MKLVTDLINKVVKKTGNLIGSPRVAAALTMAISIQLISFLFILALAIPLSLFLSIVELTALISTLSPGSLALIFLGFFTLLIFLFGWISGIVFKKPAKTGKTVIYRGLAIMLLVILISYGLDLIGLLDAISQLGLLGSILISSTIFYFIVPPVVRKIK